MGQELDSDSDLDDFRYVIAESQKAIKFTQSTLSKNCRDVMETGVCLDPTEYVRLARNTQFGRYLLE